MALLLEALASHGEVARVRLAGATPALRAELEARLARHHATGAEAWPELPLGDVAFAAAVAHHVEPEGEIVPEGLHATDFFLAAACTSEVPGAIAALSRVHLSQIPLFIAHVCRSTDRESPEDVAQAIAERVAVSDGERPPKIASYSGRGPLGGWLRVLSVRMALNTKRGAMPSVGGAPVDLAALPDGFDPELDHFKWRYKDAFKVAFEAALASLDEEQRLLLRLHSSGTHRGEDIARILGVERSTVMRRLARARETLFTSTRDRMAEGLRLTPSEFESIARALQSNIELTLSRVLGPRAPGAGEANGLP
ncbi:MAG: hypothetical protein JST00_16285 [Deltaproteobacteria bacterium]|nr:hypothetical protein [Deltaproteobacteria bacterium]